MLQNVLYLEIIYVLINVSDSPIFRVTVSSYLIGKKGRFFKSRN
jgi:hypothetical protein